MNNLKFNNYSRLIREKEDYDIYAWCIYFDAEKDQMDKTEAVEYILHHTFPDPVRRVYDPKNCFALQSEAWGSFKLQINIFFTDGETQDTEYYLKLKENNWPMGPELIDFPDEQFESVYNSLLDERYDWRKLSTIIRRSNMPEKKVIEILENLSEQGFVRKAYYPSIDKQDLWGATSVVGILPKLRE